MKMLAEEKNLRNFLRGGYTPESIPEEKKLLSSLINSLVKAVREDCAVIGYKEAMRWDGVVESEMERKMIANGVAETIRRK
jgi:ferritin-like protein